MDLMSGYHQLIIDQESRMKATFCTPWGNYSPKHLIFGAKSLQDMFDGAMFRIFGDIPQNMNPHDGLIRGKKDQEEHDRTPQKVLQSTKQYGMKFNGENVNSERWKSPSLDTYLQNKS